MTAGQIAKALDIENVIINYRASKIQLKQTFLNNPMSKLEYTKYNFDFEWMKYENALYSTEDFFPIDIKF